MRDARERERDWKWLDEQMLLTLICYFTQKTFFEGTPVDWQPWYWRLVSQQYWWSWWPATDGYHFYTEMAVLKIVHIFSHIFAVTVSLWDSIILSPRLLLVSYYVEMTYIGAWVLFMGTDVWLWSVCLLCFWAPESRWIMVNDGEWWNDICHSRFYNQIISAMTANRPVRK